MASFDIPDAFPVTDESRKVTSPWASWFSWAQATLSAARQSGVTAKRPVVGLWVGRRYWDTDLAIPVFVASVRPTVWVDAAGVVV
jgi:hypothetical protein